MFSFWLLLKIRSSFLSIAFIILNCGSDSEATPQEGLTGFFQVSVLQSLYTQVHNVPTQWDWLFSKYNPCSLTTSPLVLFGLLWVIVSPTRPVSSAISLLTLPNFSMRCDLTLLWTNCSPSPQELSFYSNIYRVLLHIIYVGPCLILATAVQATWRQDFL